MPALDPDPSVEIETLGYYLSSLRDYVRLFALQK